MNRRDFIRLLGTVPVVAAIPATKVANELTAGAVVTRIEAIDFAAIGSRWTEELQAVLMQTLADAFSEPEVTTDEPITITVVGSEIGE